MNIIEKYLDQKDSLPTQVKNLLKDKNILLYALADLDDELRLCEKWLVVTAKELIIVENDEVVKLISLAKIARIKEIRSLSNTTFLFIESDDKPAIGKIIFSSRQKVTMSNLKYVVEMLNEDGSDCKSSFANADEQYQESVLKPFVDARSTLKSGDQQVLWRLLSYLGPYKKELLTGGAGASLATLMSLVPAYLSGYLIDDVVKPFQGGVFQKEKAMELAWVILGAIALTKVMREFFARLRLHRMSIMGEYVARDLRKQLFEHLQTLGMDFYSRKQTGSIISRVSSDTDRIWDFIAFGVVEVGISLMTLLGLSSVLIFLDWRLGLLITLPVPLFIFAIYYHGKVMQKLFLKGWRKWSNLTSVLSDTIPGIQVVKAFGQESKEMRRFGKANSECLEQFNGIHDRWTSFWPFLMLGIHMSMLSVWFFALPRLFESTESASFLSAGTFVSFLLYMTMFTAPIEVIGQMSRMLNRALSSAYRIFEILDTRPSIKQGLRPLVLEHLKGDVEFKDVSFSYDGMRKIIKDMSFKVRHGEMIGLVGMSGGGKSTITKLITRFYDIGEGEILIDGINLKELDLPSFRRQVGMVLQDPFLFHGSILDNISYGVEDVSKKEIVAAAKVANAHQFISKLPYGYDTVVGERGHTLSGGERQRISIARAVLLDPKILILDEATSAVDTETERKIQDALDRLVEGRTVFAIAHRLSTLRKADRLLVIEDGKLKEEGTHAQLLTQEQGVYKKLCSMQQEMSEIFAL